MLPHLVYYPLAVVGCLWLGLMLPYIWPSRRATSPQQPTAPVPVRLKRQRTGEPTPCAGLTQRPPCAACDPEAHHPLPAPPRQPDPMPATNRRPGVIATSMHFCPPAGCDSRGWLGLGPLRAHGHPSGGPWRQCSCRSCRGYVLDSHGPMVHGKHLPVALIVHALACLAEGLGIRATARVCAVDPNIVWQWLVEAAEQLQAFSRSFLWEGHVAQRNSMSCTLCCVA